jgi:hypothetical protein
MIHVYKSLDNLPCAWISTDQVLKDPDIKLPIHRWGLLNQDLLYLLGRKLIRKAVTLAVGNALLNRMIKDFKHLRYASDRLC